MPTRTRPRRVNASPGDTWTNQQGEMWVCSGGFQWERVRDKNQPVPPLFDQEYECEFVGSDSDDDAYKRAMKGI